LHSNFTWTGSSPINHSWHQKTRDTGLHDGEDFRVLTQYRSVTDRWTDEHATAYTAACWNYWSKTDISCYDAV